MWLYLLGALGAALLFVSVILVFRPTVVYSLVTRLVVVDDSLEEADFIYVLNGRIEPRAKQAATLHHQGFAPRILLVHAREMDQRPRRPLSDVIAAEIAAKGVPPEVISVIPFQDGVVNTRDEAEALRAYLERHPAEHVIVVTMDYHTGRAKRALVQELRGLPVDVDVSMAAASDPRLFNPDNWWNSKRGREVYFGELLKLMGTVLLGVIPFQ